MRRMIIANTYYQLIIAMQLRNTLFKHDEVVLLLSDHSRNADKICKNLNKAEVFSQTLFLQSKEVVYNERDDAIAKVKQILTISLGIKTDYDFYLNGFENRYFDEVIFYNFETDIYALYSALYKYNPQIEFSIMEEGVFSYDFILESRKKYKIIEYIRKITGRKNLRESIEKFYCLFPENYRGNLKTVKVPLLEPRSKTALQLSEVFEIGKCDNLYTGKYIFFTSVYDFEGACIGEYAVVEKLCDIVGKENVIIKVHPRDTRSIYVDNGFKVDSNSEIPWEVIQLTNDFSDKVYLTAISGSVLAGSVLSKNKVKTYYLFKLCDLSKNEAAKRICEAIEKTLNERTMKKYFDKIEIVDNIEEIL